MRRHLTVLSTVMGLALLGAAPPEFMLCFHRDGTSVLERFQERCCEAEGPPDAGACGETTCPAPSDCPDDQCRDLPLAIEADEGLQAPSVEAPPPAPIPCPIDARSPDIARPRAPAPSRPDGLDPPASPPLAFLRTVVLRP